MNKFRGALFVAVILAATAAYAHADTITTFNVSGSANNVSGETLGSCAIGATCSFSGTLTVDVTNGTATAIDVTFPGLSAFDTWKTTIPVCSGGFSDCDMILFNGSGGDDASFEFQSSPSVGSLVGFTGGTFEGNDTVHALSGFTFYTYSGSISAPESSSVPEPGSLVLMLMGLAAVGFFATRRIRRRIVT